MKKNLFLFSLFIVPAIALASGTGPSLCDILTNARDALYTIFIVIVTIMFIYAGIMFVTSSGDTKKLETAKKALIWAAIGTFLGLISGSIFKILTGWLTGGSSGGSCTI